jgi:hypothetical protein
MLVPFGHGLDLNVLERKPLPEPPLRQALEFWCSLSPRQGGGPGKPAPAPEQHSLAEWPSALLPLLTVVELTGGPLAPGAPPQPPTARVHFIGTIAGLYAGGAAESGRAVSDLATQEYQRWAMAFFALAATAAEPVQASYVVGCDEEPLLSIRRLGFPYARPGKPPNLFAIVNIYQPTQAGREARLRLLSQGDVRVLSHEYGLV